MAEVDPADNSVKRYEVRHHKYDPETRHFRWFTLKCYDNEPEMMKHLNELWSELEARRLRGEAGLKEQIAGRTVEPEMPSTDRQFARNHELK